MCGVIDVLMKSRLYAKWRLCMELSSRGGLLLVVLTVGWVPGCGPGEIAEPSSPVVSSDSPAGKKARKQDEQFKALRRQQEAQAYRRMRDLPALE